MRRILSYRPDAFITALIATIVVASFLPCRGVGQQIFEWLSTAAIALLFFLQGARLPRETVVAGITHWRLHLTILASTFIFFPIVGVIFHTAFPNLLSRPLWLGILFVCTLPSTVQSSIAFTSIGRGNVPAAICSATASNIFGILITPLLVGVVLRLHGGISASSIWKIVAELLVPFCLGQLLRPFIGAWAQRNKKMLSLTDRGSVLLVVYTAFSEAVVQGLWHQIPLEGLAMILVVDAVILAIVLLATTYGSRLLGFNHEDEVAIVFCGSKKSLATGVPMAKVLFPSATVGVTVLPLMIFHQMQLMVCAVLARRYARRFEQTALADSLDHGPHARPIPRDPAAS
ncbi:bile acid:sodium symporter family protein [Faunimonas pinastri]